MKNFAKILIFSLFAITTYAQQATEIDSKSVKLPRYADLTAIQAAIPTAQQGMMVYNIETASNWYYNGINWLDMTAGSVVAPLSLSSSSATVITATTSATGEGGMKGVTTNDMVGFGVWGLATPTTPTATTYGIYGQNNSTNANGVGVGGIHNGTGWGGYFGGTNALKTFGKTYLDGAVSITNANFLEFGKGLTKQEDNGKIAYNAFGEANTLSIVGGGIANDGSDRKIKMWANGGTIFNGGASFDKSVNIGSFDLEPIAKLQVSSAATSEAPSIAIIDTAPDNQNGGILQFRNQTGLHRFDVQGLFGLQSLPLDSYLSFNKNGSPLMRLRGDGKLGLGVIDPSEKIDLVGNIQLDGEIKPNGISGTAGQVLSSNGDGTMKWGDGGSIFGQIIEVSPSLADTAALRTKGFALIGKKTQIVDKSGTQLGNVVPHLKDAMYFDPTGELFYSSTLNKLFSVSGGGTKTSISTFDLAEATYGNKQTYTTPNYDLTNTKALFTGSKILIYPYFIFDCATGTTTTFPTNTCSGITVTKSQVWTGTRLVLYGPTGGFTFNPTNNTYLCIETPTGNLFNASCSATWTGNLVVFYGGYITVSGNKISVDGGVTYNPTSNIWDDIPAGGPRVHNHNAIWTGTEILITGGTRDNGTEYGHFQDNLYNPTSFSWNSGYTPNLKDFQITNTSKSILANNKIFYFNVSGTPTNNTLYNFYFNVLTRTWVGYSTSYKHRNGFLKTMPVSVSNSIMYFSNIDAECTMTNYGNFAYNLETGSIPSIMPAWNTNIFTNSPKVNNNKYVLVIGNLGAAWLYNADNSRWKKTNNTNLPSDRTGHVVKAIDGSNKFLVWGGLSSAVYNANGGIYDATTDIWTPISGINAPTENLGCTMGNGKAMFWGTNSGKMYNIASNSWSNISVTNSPTIAGSLFWYDFKFIHVSNNGIKFYIPSTDTWVNGTTDVKSAFMSTGKYLINARQVYNTENEVIKPYDMTDLFTVSFIEISKQNDDKSYLKINSGFKTEVINIENDIVEYLPVKIENEYQNIELLKISATKYLILGDLIAEGLCATEFDGAEFIKLIDNTKSTITVPLNLKTLVYKKK
jgi:hypothetical protein